MSSKKDAEKDRVDLENKIRELANEFRKKHTGYILDISTDIEFVRDGEDFTKKYLSRYAIYVRGEIYSS